MRPKSFVLDYSHSLAKGLVFAGLGAMAGGTHYHDSSIEGNHGTCGNVAWLLRNGRAMTAHASKTDAVDLGLTLAPADRPLTIAFRFRADSVARVRHIIWSNDNAGYDPSVSVVLAQDSGTTYKLGLYSGAYTYSSTFTLDTTDTHHYAVTWAANGDCVFYRDGAVVSSSTRASGGNDAVANLGRLGPSPGLGTTWDMVGDLGDVTAHVRLLSPGEIRQLADPSNVMLSGMIRDVGDIGNVYDIENIR